MGARGNSGVILSQILRGIARSLDDQSTITGPMLAAALAEGSRIAYKGVNRPVEGTILTVVREAAAAAESAATLDSDLRFILARTVRAADEAVANTPKLLPVLAQAGKVDSGGKGLFFILEGMYRALIGEKAEAEPAGCATGPAGTGAAPQALEGPARDPAAGLWLRCAVPGRRRGPGCRGDPRADHRDGRLPAGRRRRDAGQGARSRARPRRGAQLCRQPGLRHRCRRGEHGRHAHPGHAGRLRSLPPRFEDDAAPRPPQRPRRRQASVRSKGPGWWRWSPAPGWRRSSAAWARTSSSPAGKR